MKEVLMNISEGPLHVLKAPVSIKGNKYTLLWKKIGDSERVLSKEDFFKRFPMAHLDNETAKN